MIQIHVEPADHATDLCRIMGTRGSDKGNESNTARHDYTRYYHAVFSQMRESCTRVFELGIFGGASLRGWRDYFPGAIVYGADIDPGAVSAVRGESCVVATQCDETDPSQVLQMWRAIGAGLDIIIDDALHTFIYNRRFFNWSNHMLKSGGIYICEDLPEPELPLFRDWAEHARTAGWAAHVLDGSQRIVNGERVPDNSLLVLRRP